MFGLDDCKIDTAVWDVLESWLCLLSVFPCSCFLVPWFPWFSWFLICLTFDILFLSIAHLLDLWGSCLGRVFVLNEQLCIRLGVVSAVINTVQEKKWALLQLSDWPISLTGEGCMACLPCNQPVWLFQKVLCINQTATWMFLGRDVYLYLRALTGSSQKG